VSAPGHIEAAAVGAPPLPKAKFACGFGKGALAKWRIFGQTNAR